MTCTHSMSVMVPRSCQQPACTKHPPGCLSPTSVGLQTVAGRQVHTCAACVATPTAFLTVPATQHSTAQRAGCLQDNLYWAEDPFRQCTGDLKPADTPPQLHLDTPMYLHAHTHAAKGLLTVTLAKHTSVLPHPSGAEAGSNLWLSRQPCCMTHATRPYPCLHDRHTSCITTTHIRTAQHSPTHHNTCQHVM
jgi:hypothetical protein